MARRIAVRVVLFLFCLEMFFRVGAVVSSSINDYINRGKLKDRQAYRIMCIGDSMTALGGEHSYPSQLEKVLNERGAGRTFEVLNKGVAAATAMDILARLKRDIEINKPNMVIAMIRLDKGPLEPEEPEVRGLKAFLKRIRIYQAYGVVKDHVMAQVGQWKKSIMNSTPAGEKLAEEKYIEIAKEYADFAKGHGAADEMQQRDRFLQQALTYYPYSLQLRWGAVVFYENAKDFSSMEREVRVALGLVPEGNNLLKLPLFNLLAESLLGQAKYDEAEDIYMHLVAAAANDPANQFTIWGALTELYARKGDFDKARLSFIKQISLDPGRPPAVEAVVNQYGQHLKHAELEALLRETIPMTDPRSYIHRQFEMELGRVLLVNKKFDEAAVMFNAVLKELEGFNDNINLDMGKQARQNLDLVRIKGAPLYKDEEYSPSRVRAYREIYNVLRAQGVVAVFVQFPMRPVSALKAIFPEQDIFFVDNGPSFQDAVAHTSYETYFVDHCKGDFGHFSARGGRLLAENVAAVILRQVLDRR